MLTSLIDLLENALRQNRRKTREAAQAVLNALDEDDDMPTPESVCEALAEITEAYEDGVYEHPEGYLDDAD